MREPTQRVEATTHIEAPPAAAWRLLADPRCDPEWIHFVREVPRVTGDPPEKGTTYECWSAR